MSSTRYSKQGVIGGGGDFLVDYYSSGEPLVLRLMANIMIMITDITLHTLVNFTLNIHQVTYVKLISNKLSDRYRNVQHNILISITT